MNKLPKWFLTKGLPAYTDHESATAIEQTYKLYQSMNTLIEEYNGFVDSTNNTIEEFINKYNGDIEVFATSLRQEFQDFIDVIDLKIGEFDKYLAVDNELDPNSQHPVSNEVITHYFRMAEQYTNTKFHEVDERLQVVEKTSGEKVVKHINFNTEFCLSLKDNEFHNANLIVAEDAIRDENYAGVEYNDDGNTDVLILDFSDCGYGDVDLEYGYHIAITGIKSNAKIFIKQWSYTSHINLHLVTKDMYRYDYLTRQYCGEEVSNHISSIFWTDAYPGDDSTSEVLFSFVNVNSTFDMLIEFERLGNGYDSHLHVKMSDIIFGEL